MSYFNDQYFNDENINFNNLNETIKELIRVSNKDREASAYLQKLQGELENSTNIYVFKLSKSYIIEESSVREEADMLLTLPQEMIQISTRERMTFYKKFQQDEQFKYEIDYSYIYKIQLALKELVLHPLTIVNHENDEYKLELISRNQEFIQRATEMYSPTLDISAYFIQKDPNSLPSFSSTFLRAIDENDNV